MGTTTAVQPSVELVLKSVTEYLAPSGDYEKKKLALKAEYDQVLLSAAKITAITSPEEAESATAHARLLQAGRKEVEAFFKPVKQKIDGIKAPILADEKALGGPLETEQKRIGVLQTAWDAVVEKQDKERQRLADEAAKKQAEEEALQRAIDLAAAGEDEAADAVLEEPVVAAPVVIQSTYSRPTGAVKRKYYKCKVTDFKALVAAVAAGTVPILALQFNESFLNKQADTFKEGFEGMYPGCSLDTSTSTSYRA